MSAPQAADGLLSLWYKALASPLGIEISMEESAVDRVMQKMYLARREALDPLLDTVAICKPAIAGRLWLVRKAQK